MKRRVLTTCLVMLLCLGSSVNLLARALDNSGIGIKGFSMAAAFYGIADDASAVYYNPGGLAFLDENSLHAEVYGYLVNLKFRYSAGPVESESDEKFLIPGFFISKTYKKFAFGLGAYVPFGGGGVEYKNFLGSPVDLKSSLGLVSISPTIAYKIGPKLSLGVGFCMYYGRIEADVSGVESRYSGMAGANANIGLMYKPAKKWSMGLSVRTPISVRMPGWTKTAGFKIGSEVEFKLPYYFSLGVGYKPNANLTLGFSVVYMLWGDTDKMTFTTMGIQNDFPTYYENSWFAGLGMEYKISQKLAARAGVNYYQTSTKDEGLSPDSNDVDLFSMTVGFGYKLTRCMEFNVSGVFTFGAEREYNFQTFDQDHLILLSGFRFTF